MINMWKRYYAILNEEDNTFILLKKSFKGKVALKISLNPDIHGQVLIKVYPMRENETDILLIFNQQRKFKLRAESPLKRMEWLQALNDYSKNLTDDLNILEYPMLGGKTYRKHLDDGTQGMSDRSENLSTARSRSIYQSAVILDCELIAVMKQHKEMEDKLLQLKSTVSGEGDDI